jgi:hypothetical protein
MKQAFLELSFAGYIFIRMCIVEKIAYWLRRVRLSFCLSACINFAPTGRIPMNLLLNAFMKINLINYTFGQNRTKFSGTFT